MKRKTEQQERNAQAWFSLVKNIFFLIFLCFVFIIRKLTKPLSPSRSLWLVLRKLLPILKLRGPKEQRP